MKYIINKGRHYHSLWPFPFWIFLNKKVLEFTAEFDISCKYFFDDLDKFDVNKLYGLSFGNHHNNSARYGWNYDQKSGNINLYFYCYVNGERQMGYLCDVPLHTKIKCKLSLFNDGYLFGVNGQHAFIQSDCKKKLSFLLHPYFGGNKKAPHKIKINVNRSTNNR